MSAERHRWVVDAIEEGVAAIEEDGERLVHVPSWLLPADVREGTILSVEREKVDASSSVIRVAIDAVAAREARRRSRNRPRRGGDAGGDIQL